jgi:hypothetical protein
MKCSLFIRKTEFEANGADQIRNKWQTGSAIIRKPCLEFEHLEGAQTKTSTGGRSK